MVERTRASGEGTTGAPPAARSSARARSPSAKSASSAGASVRDEGRSPLRAPQVVSASWAPRSGGCAESIRERGGRREGDIDPLLVAGAALGARQVGEGARERRAERVREAPPGGPRGAVQAEEPPGARRRAVGLARGGEEELEGLERGRRGGQTASSSAARKAASGAPAAAAAVMRSTAR